MYYKVCAKVHDQYFSFCWYDGNLTDGTVKYIPGKWTLPKKGLGPLCVFSTQEQAQDFVSRMNWYNSYNLVILPCIIQKSNLPYIEDKTGRQSLDNTVRFNPGTVFADAVQI